MFEFYDASSGCAFYRIMQGLSRDVWGFGVDAWSQLGAPGWNGSAEPLEWRANVYAWVTGWPASTQPRYPPSMEMTF
jgi:hypothetical protein